MFLSRNLAIWSLAFGNLVLSQDALLVRPTEELDFLGCYADLARADRDSDGFIQQDEYLGFIQEYGKRICFATDRLTLQHVATFNTLACLCLTQAGSDADCCIGRNAMISTAGALEPVNLQTPGQRNYLTSVCKLTDATLDGGCGLMEMGNATIPVMQNTSMPTPSPTNATENPNADLLEVDSSFLNETTLTGNTSISPGMVENATIPMMKNTSMPTPSPMKVTNAPSSVSQKPSVEMGSLFLNRTSPIGMGNTSISTGTMENTTIPTRENTSMPTPSPTNATKSPRSVPQEPPIAVDLVLLNETTDDTTTPTTSIPPTTMANSTIPTLRNTGMPTRSPTNATGAPTSDSPVGGQKSVDVTSAPSVGLNVSTTEAPTCPIPAVSVSIASMAPTIPFVNKTKVANIEESCILNKQCVEEWSIASGTCCPTVEGDYLDCCDVVPDDCNTFAEGCTVISAREYLASASVIASVSVGIVLAVGIPSWFI